MTFWFEEDDDAPVDELVRTRRYREYCQQKIQAMQRLGAPPEVIEYEREWAKLTYSEYLQRSSDEQREEEQQRSDYRNQNPMDPQVAERILAEFDQWFEKNQNKPENLKRELAYGGEFKWRWFQGYYPVTLSEMDQWSRRYEAVFELCRIRIRTVIGED